MALSELKTEFSGGIAVMGGIDVRAMAYSDPTVIEKEISTKIPERISKASSWGFMFILLICR